MSFDKIVLSAFFDQQLSLKRFNKIKMITFYAVVGVRKSACFRLKCITPTTLIYEGYLNPVVGEKAYYFYIF